MIKTQANQRYIPQPGFRFRAYVLTSVAVPPAHQRYKRHKGKYRYFGHECRQCSLCTCIEDHTQYITAVDDDGMIRKFSKQDFFFERVGTPK